MFSPKSQSKVCTQLQHLLDYLRLKTLNALSLKCRYLVFFFLKALGTKYLVLWFFSDSYPTLLLRYRHLLSDRCQSPTHQRLKLTHPTPSSLHRPACLIACTRHFLQPRLFAGRALLVVSAGPGHPLSDPPSSNSRPLPLLPRLLETTATQRRGDRHRTRGRPVAPTPCGNKSVAYGTRE